MESESFCFEDALLRSNTLKQVSEQGEFKVDNVEPTQSKIFKEYLVQLQILTFRKGFSLSATQKVAKFGYDLVLNTAAKDLTLTAAICWLNSNILNYFENLLSLQQIKDVTNFIYRTFFQHYHLFSYVCTIDRETIQISIHNEVETAPESIDAKLSTVYGALKSCSLRINFRPT